MNLSIEIIGFTAGACTTLSFLPQVLKVWKTRTAEDISLLMYIIFCFGVVLWFIYGYCLGSISMIIANIITFSLALPILIMKILWGRKTNA